MKKTSPNGSHEPTGVSVAMTADFPGVKEGKPPAVAWGNAHPHQEHSVGYSGENIYSYDNHGFMAQHVVHPKRDKNMEHHPPQAYMAGEMT